MHNHILGWDVGGAHLKTVLLGASGEVLQALQVPCALWLGLDELESAIETVLQQHQLAKNEICHAITMTGELVDLFENRQQGVLEISRVMDEKLSGEKLFYFANLDISNQKSSAF